MENDEDDSRAFDPCPRCGAELMLDGDGFEYCLTCAYHESDQASAQSDELEFDGGSRDISDGFSLADDGDVVDERDSHRLSVFGTVG